MTKIKQFLHTKPENCGKASGVFKKNSSKKFYKSYKKRIFNILQQRTKKAAIAVTKQLKERLSTKPVLKRKRRHKERRIWRSFKKNLPYHQRKQKRVKKRHKKQKLRFENHFLNITVRRKNVFLAFYQKLPIRKRRLKRINLIASKTLGSLGYKGRHKTSPLAKEVLGKTLGNSLQKNNLSLIDIIFQKKIGRVYKPILKGLAKNRILIRKIRLKIVHPHGTIRSKKKKRK